MLALELGEEKWKLGFSSGFGQVPLDMRPQHVVYTFAVSVLVLLGRPERPMKAGHDVGSRIAAADSPSRPFRRPGPTQSHASHLKSLRARQQPDPGSVNNVLGFHT